MPEAAAVSGSVAVAFAFSVGFRRTQTVQEAPGASGGSFCCSGVTRMPLVDLTRSEPWAEVVAPVFVTLIFTAFVLPAFSLKGFALAIESAGGPERELPGPELPGRGAQTVAARAGRP